MKLQWLFNLKVNDRRKIDKINFEEELEKLINKEMQVELNKLDIYILTKLKKAFI